MPSINSTVSTTIVASMTSTASCHQKTFNLEKKKDFWWFVIFFTWKSPLKVKIIQNLLRKEEILTNWTIGGVHYQKINTDEFGIKAPFSWTCRIQNINKNYNIYLHQSHITLPGLLWDTLYLRQSIWETYCKYHLFQ